MPRTIKHKIKRMLQKKAIQKKAKEPVSKEEAHNSIDTAVEKTEIKNSKDLNAILQAIQHGKMPHLVMPALIKEVYQKSLKRTYRELGVSFKQRNELAKATKNEIELTIEKFKRPNQNKAVLNHAIFEVEKKVVEVLGKRKAIIFYKIYEKRISDYFKKKIN